MTPRTDPKWQPHNQREADAMDRNVARQLENAPPLGIEQARRIVALMWPHGLPQATTTRRKAS